ncbi:S8 family serine peptidase [Arthrobacter sp. ATA002]|uniref:S8 family serine peptidase n=1 Tax=Arthrobacter sp. ATA002 TaxID=2991715 RepID=UPI0022A7937C|nr:S8 family serine peptidase [Arthrobacter sp. ATA002]WAP53445.1 S8 family serine peptidase [Arthrobacter sp. ATA002]
MLCLRIPFPAVAAAAALALGGTLLAVPAPAAADPAPEPGAVEPAPATAHRFIVKFADTAAPGTDRAESYAQATGALDASVTELHETAAGSLVVTVDKDLSAADTAAVVDTLAADPTVEYVEPDVLLLPSAADPNDPLYPAQWNLRAAGGGANVAAAWNTGIGERQVVAVVDTGITAHTDLNGKVLPGYDVMSDAEMAADGDGRDANPRDEGDWYDAGSCGRTVGAASTWHGTHVAGIVAASTGNGTGISGVAPDALILPVRAMGTCGGYMSDISDGIVWAAGGTVPGIPVNPTPARVINLSLGGVSTCSPSMQQAVDYAVGRGAVVVAAAGNDAISAHRTQPANCSNVVVVGAGDRDGSRARYSNFGSLVDIMAPGGSTYGDAAGGIMSTLNSGTSQPAAESYGYYQGTSMAAPHVAGTAALLLAADPALSPAQVEFLLKKTARPLPGICAPYCGPGLLDAGAALTAAVPPFADVPFGLAFHDEILWMAAEGISTGWAEANGTVTYRPFQAVNRDAMAAFIYRMEGSPPFNPPQKSPFADVSTTSQFYTEITWLNSRGISTGWREANGTYTYRPTTPVNRDAMAAFMYRYAESPAYAAPQKPVFSDVAPGAQFYKEMSWLVSSGITTGWDDGTYRPVTPVARDAMAAFMHRFDSRFGQ